MLTETGKPTSGVAAAKLSLAGVGAMSNSMVPVVPFDPSMTIRYSVPATAGKVSRLLVSQVSSSLATSASMSTWVPL